MNIPTLCRLGAAVLVLCIVGCGPSRVALKPTFWKETQQTIGVTTVVAPKLGAYRAGGEGLLDMAINNAMSGSLEAHLQSLDASRFNVVADHYVAKLNERGFKARRLPGEVDPVKMAPFKAEGSGEFAAVDLRPLGQKEGVDKLILLSLQQCGTLRAYYGFIPLGAPQALCVSKGELIDVKTNQVEWRAFAEQANATVEIVGEWDAPPDFRNVTVAVEQAMKQAQVFVFEEFFGPRTARFQTPAPAVATETPAAQH
jgi:hypothetical protein